MSTSMSMGMEKIIGDDVAYEILLRLNVKSLLRFRCVSKVWCEMIDSVAFATAFMHKQVRNEILTVPFFTNGPPKVQHSIVFDGNVIKESEYPILAFNQRKGNKEVYEISQVGYGLICYKHKRAREGFLCNPLRGEVLKLPPSKLDGKKYIYKDRYGLGFDSATNTYKIVRFFNFPSTHVYTLGSSSKSKSWRRISSAPPASPLSRVGVSAYGDMHWTHDVFDGEARIISFDFKKEEFRQIPLPDFGKPYKATRIKLINLKGSLAIVMFSTINTRLIEIWVLKDYNDRQHEHWIREYSIKHSVLLWEYMMPPWRISITALGDALLFDYGSNDRHVFILDLNTSRMLYLLCPARDDESFRYSSMLFPYTQTCLSLQNFGYPSLQQDLTEYHRVLKTVRVVYVCNP